MIVQNYSTDICNSVKHSINKQVNLLDTFRSWFSISGMFSIKKPILKKEIWTSCTVICTIKTEASYISVYNWRLDLLLLFWNVENNPWFLWRTIAPTSLFCHLSFSLVSPSLSLCSPFTTSTMTAANFRSVQSYITAIVARRKVYWFNVWYCVQYQ